MIEKGICHELRCWNDPACTHPEHYKSGNCGFLIWFEKDVLRRRFVS